MTFGDSVLHEFYQQNKPTKEFMSWAKKNMIYNYANHLVSYFAYYDINHKQYKTEIINTDLFPVDDDSAIVTGLYAEHLSNYVVLKYAKEDSIVTNFLRKRILAVHTPEFLIMLSGMKNPD